MPHSVPWAIPEARDHRHSNDNLVFFHNSFQNIPGRNVFLRAVAPISP